jgi:hypothetical protein
VREPAKSASTGSRRNHPGCWKPGQSGNPAGRPKGTRSLTTLIRDYLEKEHDNGLTKGQYIAKRLVELSCEGEQWATKELLDRMEGKAVARVEQSIDIPQFHAAVTFGKIIDVTPEPLGLEEGGGDET